MDAASIVLGLLNLVAAVAPGILAAATGKQSDDEAIAAMIAAVDKLPKRTGEGGTWAQDLADRKGDEFDGG